MSRTKLLELYCESGINEIISETPINRLDRKIDQGRQDIKNGNFTLVNEQTTTAFITHLSKKLITENNNNETL